MNYTDIISNINKKIFSPIYFLYGKEPYFIDVLSQYFANNILSPDEVELNQTIIYGKDVAIRDLVSYLKVFPMMSNYRVVILKEAQDIKEKDFEFLAPYFEKPQLSTIFVVCYKNDIKKSIEKLLKSNPSTVVAFESTEVRESSLPTWIINYLKERLITCSAQTAQIIASSLGNDLSKISNELDKLLINTFENGIITMDDVENNIGISKKYNIFELQNALISNNRNKAIDIAIHFASNSKETPIFMIINVLNSFFEKLFVFLQHRGKKDINSIAKMMGINPYLLENYKKASRHYNLNKVLKVFEIFRDYDMKAKGYDNVTNEDELIKEMILKIVYL